MSVLQVLALEGLGWKDAAFVHGGSGNAGAAADSGMLQRSDILAFGIATGTYLLIVVVQLVLQWLLQSVNWPVIGNVEDPTDSFRCVPYSVHTMSRNLLRNQGCCSVCA